MSTPIAHEVRTSLLERFLRYVAIDTESDPKSDTYASTARPLLATKIVQLSVSSLM